MKPRIVIFSTAYYPFVGGAEVAIKEITDRLASQFDFEMITARLDAKLAKEEQIGSVLVHRIGFGSNFDKLLVPFLGALKVAEINKKREVNLFFPVMATYASGAAYIYNIFHSRKIPVVLNLQEGDSEEHLTKRHFGLIDLSWKMALKRSSYITALSNYLMNRARSLGYKGLGKVIPNAVNAQAFASNLNKRERTALRKKLGFSEDDFVLITTGRLVVKNGVADIIKALAYLPKEVKFLSVGSGPLEAELKLLVKSYKLEGRIVWLGFVPNNELPNYLAASDAFVRPSLSEGLGISFLEAMAAGLPVVATPVGGIPDFLKDGLTGLVCEVGNPVSIADCVKRLVANSNLRKELGKYGQEQIERRYSWDVVVPQIAEVFNSVMLKP